DLQGDRNPSPASASEGTAHAPPATRGMAPPRETSTPSAWSLRAGGTYQHSAANWNAFGAEVHGYRALSRPLRLGLAARAYQALRVRDPLGSVAATGAGLGLSLGMCHHDMPVRLCVDAQLAADHLAFDTRSSAGASARQRSDWPVVGALALSTEWPATGRVFCGVELRAGAALHGVEAQAGGRTVTGLSGAVFGISVYAGARQ
ncbi:MAG: hypothetical protein RL385_4451, partial [Pseudomonadota bacterium]